MNEVDKMNESSETEETEGMDQTSVCTVENLLEQIRAELIANADSTAKASEERFFKEPIHMYGMMLSRVG